MSTVIIPTPSWQAGTGVPAGRTGRYTPDVSFTASGHDAYFICLAANNLCSGTSNLSISYGTSAAAPDMAGITALLNQKEGSAQGLLNPKLYQLAATPSNNVFNDVTVATSGVTGCAVTTPSMCNNSTPGPTSLTGGLSGYLVTPGFDEATGLGSINVANLLTSWSPGAPTTTTLSIAPTSVTAGSSGPVVMTATVTSTAGTPTGTVNFFKGSSQVGGGTLSNGTATFNYNPSALKGGTYSITGTYSSNGTFGSSTSAPQTLNVQDFTIAATPPIVTVSAPGQSGTTTLTITPINGFNQTLSYSCNQAMLPSGASCSFTAASATTETLKISTLGPSARLGSVPWGRSRALFYAMLLPALLGLVLSTGNRKGIWRGLRSPSLIGLLALSTLWMPACGGGGSSTPSNPGTPAGTSTVTVTAATTGGTLTRSATITLTVQ